MSHLLPGEVIYSGGWVMYWGLKIKLPRGRGGVCISWGIWGGGRYVPLVFLSIKNQSPFALPSPPPRTPISKLYNVNLSEPLGRYLNKICPNVYSKKETKVFWGLGWGSQTFFVIHLGGSIMFLQWGLWGGGGRKVLCTPHENVPPPSNK